MKIPTFAQIDLVLKNKETLRVKEQNGKFLKLSFKMVV
jgi:hypothetical protein